MKKKLFIFIAACCAIGLQAADSLTHITIRAKAPIEIENVNESGSAELKKSVSDPTGRHILQTRFIAKSEPQTIKVSFKADRDGAVIVQFFAARQRWKGQSTGVSNIQINGKPMWNSDFSKINEKTGQVAGLIFSKISKVYPEVIPAADGRPAMVRCSFKRSVGIRVPVKADETVTVTADLVGMEAFPDEEDTK